MSKGSGHCPGNKPACTKRSSLVFDLKDSLSLVVGRIDEISRNEINEQVGSDGSLESIDNPLKEVTHEEDLELNRRVESFGREMAKFLVPVDVNGVVDKEDVQKTSEKLAELANLLELFSQKSETIVDEDLNDLSIFISELMKEIAVC